MFISRKRLFQARKAPVKKITRLLALALSVSTLSQVRAEDKTMSAPREHLLMDTGWRFALGHTTDTYKDYGHGTGFFSYFAKCGYGDGPANPQFDDRAWRLLDLPHDWAVELPFDAKGSAWNSTGFSGIRWSG
jgi:beta-galactosidase